MAALPPRMTQVTVCIPLEEAEVIKGDELERRKAVWKGLTSILARAAPFPYHHMNV